jgi:hypothetical protein
MAKGKDLPTMNTPEAREIIQNELAVYEKKAYADLVKLIDEEFHFERQGPSGARYQVEIRFLWDSTPNGAIRILGSIDDGGWRAFVPLTDSILKPPPME